MSEQNADTKRDLVVYLEVTVRLPSDLFDGESQKSICGWLDEEYPSLAGFVADYPVMFAMAKVSNRLDRLQDYQRVIDTWRSEQYDGSVAPKET